jgi:hypothetical protein
MVAPDAWYGTPAGFGYLRYVLARNCPVHARPDWRTCPCPMHAYARTEAGARALSHVELNRAAYVTAEWSEMRRDDVTPKGR